MPRCATCRWWHIPTDESRDDAWGAARSVLTDAGHSVRYDWEDEEDGSPITAFAHLVRQCQSPLVRFYELPASNGAAVVDGSRYLGALLTGPAFGCVNHEPAEDTNGPDVK